MEWVLFYKKILNKLQFYCILTYPEILFCYEAGWLVIPNWQGDFQAAAGGSMNYASIMVTVDSHLTFLGIKGNNLGK